MAFDTKAGAIKIITYVSIIKGGKILLVQYDQAPNPTKSGWWIPAPELEYGEHPEERVDHVLESFGLSDQLAVLEDVESFETGTGWHLIFHYVVNTEKDVVKTPENVQKQGWFSLAELPPAEEIAHGKWERQVAATRLSV